MLALACLSFDSVGLSAPAVNLWFLSFLVDYLFFCFVYRSPSTDNRVYNCPRMAMGEIQSVEPKSDCFMSVFRVAGLSCYQCPRGGAFDFATLTDWSLLVYGGLPIGVIAFSTWSWPMSSTFVRLMLVHQWVGVTIRLWSWR